MRRVVRPAAPVELRARRVLEGLYAFFFQTGFRVLGVSVLGVRVYSFKGLGVSVLGVRVLGFRGLGVWEFRV